MGIQILSSGLYSPNLRQALEACLIFTVKRKHALKQFRRPTTGHLLPPNISRERDDI